MSEIIAALWIRYGAGHAEYKSVKGVVIAAREAAGLYSLVWPTKQAPAPGEANSICPVGMKRLYNALKLETSAILRHWKYGDDLAAHGHDAAGTKLEKQTGLLKASRPASLQALRKDSTYRTELPSTYVALCRARHKGTYPEPETMPSQFPKGRGFR